MVARIRTVAFRGVAVIAVATRGMVAAGLPAHQKRDWNSAGDAGAAAGIGSVAVAMPPVMPPRVIIGRRVIGRAVIVVGSPGSGLKRRTQSRSVCRSIA